MKKISFEFFPPKDFSGQESLQQNSMKLLCCEPEFFSVTYGAGGTAKQGTLETVNTLIQNTSIPTLPHLSCINATEEEIYTLINDYLRMGIKRVVALRGDKMPNTEFVGSFNYAVDLVKFIRRHTSANFHVTVAAYPEVHPEAKHAEQGLKHFKEKIDAGANSAITQFFYNPDAYFHFLDQCAANHIHVPIIPGIMPIYNFEKLLKFSQFCGAEIPRWVIKQLSSYEYNSESLKKFGIEVVYKLCDQLLQQGAPGLHFYTLNQANTCIHLCDLLGLITENRERSFKRITDPEVL